MGNQKYNSLKENNKNKNIKNYQSYADFKEMEMGK